MLELAIGAVGIVLSGVTYLVGRRDGKRSEQAIKSQVSQVPARTASIIESVFSQVLKESPREEGSRGWDMEFPATVGYADIRNRREPPRELLIECPVGAHSAMLLIFEQDGLSREVEVVGKLFNGVGFSFHVDDFLGDGFNEVGTVDYVRNIPSDRPLATAPIQAVYYRWQGNDFEEMARGPVHDPLDEAEPPPSVRRFMSKSWNVEPEDDDYDDDDYDDDEGDR